MTRDAARIRAMGFRVGDRVVHRAFGEGLIVEVRERDGFEVLEIAFSDGIRRLTSLYPLEPARGQFRVAPGTDALYQRLLPAPMTAHAITRSAFAWSITRSTGASTVFSASTGSATCSATCTRPRPR